MTTRRTPAALVIERFNGIRNLARLLGKDPSTIWRWDAPREKGGLEGRIPSTVQSDLLRLAEEQGVALTADELIRGGD